ncbi:MAG: hypothetical protein IPK29_08395 [Betaproteobacteria bacterium]|nr:hypothetical protein [Betaproteobacteria bacterium]
MNRDSRGDPAGQVPTAPDVRRDSGSSRGGSARPASSGAGLKLVGVPYRGAAGGRGLPARQAGAAVAQGKGFETGGLAAGQVLKLRKKREGAALGLGRLTPTSISGGGGAGSPLIAQEQKTWSDIVRRARITDRID